MWSTLTVNRYVVLRYMRAVQCAPLIVLITQCYIVPVVSSAVSLLLLVVVSSLAAAPLYARASFGAGNSSFYYK
jgi:hypothetical protein